MTSRLPVPTCFTKFLAVSRYFSRTSPCLSDISRIQKKNTLKKMVEAKDQEFSSLKDTIRKQGELVRELKSKNASPDLLKSAIAELKSHKKALEEKEAKVFSAITNFERSKLEDLLKEKFFYDQSFSIYGGVQGLYDYGPMGCAMKANLLAAWRQHFIIEEHLLEVDCSMLTPHSVLQASGHVERFTDLMVKDCKTGDCYRADHLIKNHLQNVLQKKDTSSADAAAIYQILVQLDNFGADELYNIITKYNMKAPTTNNDLTQPQQFNLMFETMIGPTGQLKGYLRPETAQGIFVNFQRLLTFNHGRIPFGAAQIGPAFRNEISPRSGLIRVREFTMAEIEYFVDPSDKTHIKFDRIKNIPLQLYSACDQMDGKFPRSVTVGDAVEQGIIANQSLAYFMARIHLFLISVGINPARLRFRQHLSNEMAHYARDCWDAECQTSYGWIECVGCADRSCFDLVQHIKATGARLCAEKLLPEPKMIAFCKAQPNKGAIGKSFKAAAKPLVEHLTSLDFDQCAKLKAEFNTNGKATINLNGTDFEIDKSMVTVTEGENKVFVEEIIPNVIEPSFGIGRILYAVFEHCYREREGDEKRSYLSVPSLLAPYKCSLLPLSSHPDFVPFVRHLSEELTRAGVSHRIDEGKTSIGRRYARTDQIAIPYGVTIDFDTLNKKPASVTLRERDSMKQIRVPVSELPSLLVKLSNNGPIEWTNAQSVYPSFEQQETAGTNNVTCQPTPPPSDKCRSKTKPSPASSSAHRINYGPQSDDADLDTCSSAPETNVSTTIKTRSRLGPGTGSASGGKAKSVSVRSHYKQHSTVAHQLSGYDADPEDDALGGQSGLESDTSQRGNNRVPKPEPEQLHWTKVVAKIDSILPLPCPDPLVFNNASKAHTTMVKPAGNDTVVVVAKPTTTKQVKHHGLFGTNDTSSKSVKSPVPNTSGTKERPRFIDPPSVGMPTDWSSTDKTCRRVPKATSVGLENGTSMVNDCHGIFAGPGWIVSKKGGSGGKESKNPTNHDHHQQAKRSVKDVSSVPKSGQPVTHNDWVSVIAQIGDPALSQSDALTFHPPTFIKPAGQPPKSSNHKTLPVSSTNNMSPASSTKTDSSVVAKTPSVATTRDKDAGDKESVDSSAPHTNVNTTTNKDSTSAPSTTTMSKSKKKRMRKKKQQ